MRPICASAWCRSAATEFCTRSANAAMTEARSWPRTARMNGNPNLSLYALLSSCRRENSSSVHESMPAPLCSRADSAVRPARCAAGEFGMRADQSQLFVVACFRNGAGHRRVQSSTDPNGRAATRPATQGECSKMPLSAVDAWRHRVELRQSNHCAAILANGCCAIQWRAMSMRRQIHTCSNPST